MGLINTRSAITDDRVNIIENEFNGNIDSSNLKTQAITTDVIRNDAVSAAKLVFTGASAYSDGLTTTVSGSPTKVNLNHELFDVGSNFANGTFTAPVTGYYHVDASCSYSQLTPDTYYSCMVYVDGSVYLRSYEYVGASVPAAAYGIGPTTSRTIYLAKGSTVELYYAHFGATTVDLIGHFAYTFLTINLIKEVV